MGCDSAKGLILPLKIRNAVPDEIQNLMSSADAAAWRIKNLAWAADVLMLDQFTLAGNKEQLCQALWAIFSIVEHPAKQIGKELMKGL
jgi:hypothetical protein